MYGGSELYSQKEKKKKSMAYALAILKKKKENILKGLSLQL